MDKTEIPYIKTIDGDLVKRNLVDEFDVGIDNTCGDCGQEVGKYHFMNCDIERCPVCGNQLFSCECWDAYVYEE